MAKRLESPSSINTFKQCPRKYYYQYIEQLPTLPNIHQIRGNIAHSTLEKFYDTTLEGINQENYKTEFKEIIQKLFLHDWNESYPRLYELKLGKDQLKFYFEETLLMLMNWVNHLQKDIERVIKEKKISFSEAFQMITPLREQQYISTNYSVQGFIDAIHHLDDEVHIIDYKTNSSFEFKDEIKLQLAIYSLLYQEKHGKLPSKVGIFFLRHKLKMIKVDEELLALAKKEIVLVHEHTSRTEKREDYPCKVSSLCKWGTGQCDFYDHCQPHQNNAN